MVRGPNLAAALQLELEDHGYFIIVSDFKAEIGAIWAEISNHMDDARIPGPFVVVGTATAAQFRDQKKRLGLYGTLEPEFKWFYKVAAE